MCCKTTHYFYLLSDVSLTVVVGLNSRTMIVMVSDDLVCPLPCLESSTGIFIQVLVLEDWLFSKYFFVHFDAL